MDSRTWVPVLSAFLALATVLATPRTSSAELWCADPLWVHEWGVHVFARSGAGGTRSSVPRLPSHFHGRPTRSQAVGPPVRHMPVDGGQRALPVVHFYAPNTFRPVPVGFEVGFAEGEATRWYPQVDARRSAADANGAAAAGGRTRLLAARAARADAMGGPPLGRDPTRQLAWDHLVMTASPTHRRASARVPWVGQLRGFSNALWVNGAHESERFLFYEGQTREAPAVRVERGPTYGPGRRHYVLRNTDASPIHDVFFVHRSGGRRYVFFAPTIPSGRSAGFLLEEHAVAADDFEVRTVGALRERWVDAEHPAPPSSYRWTDCVMQRDPAIPTEQAGGHRLYAHEVDAVLRIWSGTFFGAQGTTIVYREDVGSLDRAMPVSVYTDMYHFVQLRRLGLAVQEHVALP